MTTIDLQVVHYIICHDGLRRDTYRVRALFNHKPGTPERWRNWSSTAHETPTEAVREMREAESKLRLAGDSFDVSVDSDIPTVKRHHHIGEYGSPKRLRCDALD